ncbi:bifunctional alpha/beta hydrolase/OsmC family protein [Gramella jeungdoensis]|uniref:Bifunctional alpha/beta hydrolase/OsmC family protein n=1 Tax=Gramella jeungdoensis TaxID=708091 RepID=A0ABT0Z5N0_9FLAO|nr:bifunctional alpha/beta hydrolase/OsmC family protein [Gramella jeungdoensis]MCM8570733.1 bifunctional alpha/beta hydrolase/OsmC family protein [Gramella jeungdoensis]
MQKINVSFKNSESQTLTGVLEMPSNSKPDNFAIFAHCFTCNKNFHAPTNISRSLAAKGYGVLRFDFTGLGQSEGEFAETNFSGNVEDLIAAAEFLESEYRAPSLIIGHSLGGAAALFASRKIPSINCIVTINAPSSLSHVQKHFESSMEKIQKEGFAQVNIGGRNFKIKKHFVEDLKANEDSTALKDIKKAILILHSPQDNIVSIDHAEELYRAAWHPKSFISLDDADHLLSRESDSYYVANVISAWASRYIEEPEVPELSTDHEVMANLGAEGFTTQMIAGKHHFLADEPKSIGGNDQGPNPYELVSSGLAACTSMTLQMYARRKEWKIENVETHVSYSKKHSKDCENCEDDSARIDHFEREIILKGNLDGPQKERLLEIADKCPVHRTLSSKAEISTQLKNI